MYDGTCQPGSDAHRRHLRVGSLRVEVQQGFMYNGVTSRSSPMTYLILPCPTFHSHSLTPTLDTVIRVPGSMKGVGDERGVRAV